MTIMLRRKALGASAMAALLMSTSHAALAEEFSLGEGVTATTNVILRAGVSFRTEDPDPYNYSAANGARVGLVGTSTGRAAADTQDDGTLNFEKGDVVSAPVSVLADVDFNFDNTWGIFLRGKAVSDLALEFRDVQHGHGPTGFQRGKRLDDSEFDNLASFTHAELLDAFVYADFDIGETPLTVRLGRQVVSWGESALIQGGINTINPVDVSAFRRPGVELKEGLLPVGMLYANVGVTDNLSIEGFLQYEWQKTVLDGCGTYFSSVDVLDGGCEVTMLGGALGGFNDAQALAIGGFEQRGATRDPDQYAIEQFGVAARYYSAGLDTEFGAYYHRTHAKTPSLVFSQGATDVPTVAPAQYYDEYAEDIDLFGLSAATNVFGVAVAGEVSYRPEQPVSYNTNQTNGALLNTLLATGATAASPLFNGTFVPGSERAEQLKGQVSVTKFFDRVLGAARWTVLAEGGFEHLDFDSAAPGISYGRGSVFGNPDVTGYGGTVTPFSYGYRLRFIGSYPDVAYGVNVTPSISWNHDIDGTSSDGQFNDNRKGIGLGVKFDYLTTYQLDLSYTNFFDGDYDVLTDRDFVSASARVQF